MRADDDILRTILNCVEEGRYRADDVMGFIFEGIGHAVREAEFAVRGGSKLMAVERLRELQALSERLIAILAPAERIGSAQAHPVRSRHSRLSPFEGI